MSSDLYLETDPEVNCDMDYHKSDGRCLLDLITLGWADIVAQVVPLDLSFMRYYAYDLMDEDELIDAFGKEEAALTAAQHRRECELAWTSPAHALCVLDAVIEMLGDVGGEAREALMAKLDASGDGRLYRRSGDPLPDLAEVPHCGGASGRGGRTTRPAGELLIAGASKDARRCPGVTIYRGSHCTASAIAYLPSVPSLDMRTHPERPAWKRKVPRVRKRRSCGGVSC